MLSFRLQEINEVGWLRHNCSQGKKGQKPIHRKTTWILKLRMTIWQPLGICSQMEASWLLTTVCAPETLLGRACWESQCRACRDATPPVKLPLRKAQWVGASQQHCSSTCVFLTIHACPSNL